MNAGYYEKIIEYNSGKADMNLTIGDYNTKDIKSFALDDDATDAKNTDSVKRIEIQPSRI